MEAENFDFKKHRAEWIKRLAKETLKADELAPINFVPDGDHPKWLDRIEEEFGKTVFSLARLRDSIELTPKRFGSLLGYKCAYAVWMMEWIEEQFINVESRDLATDPSKEEIEQAEKMLEAFGQWYSAMRRLAKRALCSTVDQTYNDMTDFLLGYSNAFARKPRSFNAGEIGSSNFEIYVFLLMYWRIVENLKSVSQLHELLRNVLGEYRTGDLKRIEKICQRIDLHFRKPGRPKKSK